MSVLKIHFNCISKIRFYLTLIFLLGYPSSNLFSDIPTTDSANSYLEVHINTSSNQPVIGASDIPTTDSANSYLEVHIITSSNQPVVGAEVFLEEVHRKDYTNRNGIVRFSNLRSGNYEVEISIDTLHVHLSLITNQVHHIEIPTDRISLGDVRVVVHHTENTSNLLSQLHSQSLTFSNSNITQNLKSIPMMNVVSTGRTISKPMYQGTSGLRLPLMVQSTRLEGQAWGTDHGPEIGAWGSEKAEIIKGTQAISVGGDAWGNAVNIEFKPKYHPFETDIKFYSGYQSNGNMVQGGLKWIHGLQDGNGHYLVANAQKSSDYRVPQGILKNTASEEFSFYGGNLVQSPIGKSTVNYSYYYFKSGIYLGSHIGNISDLLWNIEQENPTQLSSTSSYEIAKPYQQGQQLMVSWKQQYKKLPSFTSVISMQQNQRKEYDPHRNPLNSFPQLDVVLNTGLIQGFHETHVSGIRINSGISAGVQKQSWAGYFLVPDFLGMQGAIWTVIQPFPRKKLKNEWAIRWDILQRQVTLPRDEIKGNYFQGFSGGYSREFFTHSWMHTFHITQSFRPPSVNELYSKGVHHGSAAFEEGNENLKPESGQKLEWQIQKTTSKWHVNFNSFLQHSNNYIFINPQPYPIYSIRGAFPYYKYESMAVWFAGFNLNTSIQTHLGEYGISYDYTYARLYKLQAFPTLIPPQKLRGYWSFRKPGMNALIEGIFVPKQSYYSNIWDLSSPPNSYFVLNASLGIIPRTSQANWEIKLFVENATQSNYRDYLDRFRYFVPQPARNLGIRFIYNLHHHRKHT